MRTRRCAVAALAAALALAVPGGPFAASPPQAPRLSSAPSEYVEVVPTAGGGSSTTSVADGTANAPAPGSALRAALDAAGGDDRLLGLGVTMLVVTLLLAGPTAMRRTRAASRRAHVPKG